MYAVADSVFRRTLVDARACLLDTTSIIGALHFGLAGRSIATNGMTDDRRWDRSMMLPSNRRERNISVTGNA